MNLAVGGPECMERLAPTCIEQKGIEGLTMADLSAKWRAVVEALEGYGVTVTNPDHALEGALCIRYAELRSSVCVQRVTVAYMRYKHLANFAANPRFQPHAMCCHEVVYKDRAGPPPFRKVA